MITAKSLRVDYDDLTAVWDLDLEIQAGEVYGLVGPNGAGKTSTIKAIAGLLEPTYGEVFLAGADMSVHPEDGQRHLGYMPDFPPAYENLKVWEYLDVFAAAHLVPRYKRLNRARAWAERVGLEGKWDTYLRELSRGMRQRLVLAKTLLPEPDILLLDEPASGMDPIARIEMRDLIKESATRGAAVLVSSHILTELSDVCTSVGVMEKGRMIVSGSIEEIRARIGAQASLRIRLLNPPEAAIETFRRILSECEGLHDAEKEEKGWWRGHFSGEDKAAAELLAALVAAGIPVVDFHVEREGLEDLFMRIGAREVS